MKSTIVDLDATIAKSMDITYATVQRRPIKVVMEEIRESSKENAITAEKSATKRQIVGRKKKMLISVRRIGLGKH